MSGIGAKIRRLREEKGLTVSELARQTGISTSMLSMVERDVVSPSINSLRNIAINLQVPVFYFLIEESDLNEIVTRREQRRTFQPPDYHATYQLLSPNLNKRIEMILFKLEPGEASAKEPMSHEGEECLLVLSGQFKVEMPDQEIILEEGDSIYFDRELPHRVINIGPTIAEALCAISPPSF